MNAHNLIAVCLGLAVASVVGACSYSISGQLGTGQQAWTEAAPGKAEAKTVDRPKTKEEIQAEGLNGLMWGGVGMFLVGLALMLAKMFGGVYAVMLKAVPTWVYYGLMIGGGCMIGWATLDDTMRDVIIVAGIAGGGFMVWKSWSTTHQVHKKLNGDHP